ncbi:MAG TPA: rhomboid family intramembrane serine protease [Actinomycetota bacterium]|nr:rhomboid family intramembrane serine protease [Actinomycetota bacterium]
MQVTAGLIPIHDENPARRTPLLTLMIIVANVLAFFFLEPSFGTGRNCARADVTCQVENCELTQYFFQWGVVPREVASGEPVSGEICTGIETEPKSVVLSLFTSMFLHGGFFHLAGNMLFLWVFGNNIEDRLGHVRYLVFYLLAGLAGTLAHVFSNPESLTPTIGASGAISGLLGAYIVLFPRAMIHALVPMLFFFRVRLPAMAVLGFWFISQFFIGGGQQVGEGGVAWVAHVGGFVAGMILIYLLGGGRHKPTPARPAYPQGPFSPY